MWAWVLGGLAFWVLVALGAGVVIGRGIRLGDQRSPWSGDEGPRSTADLPPGFTPVPALP